MAQIHKARNPDLWLSRRKPLRRGSTIDWSLASRYGLAALFLLDDPSGVPTDLVSGLSGPANACAIDEPGIIHSFNGAQNTNFVYPFPAGGVVPDNYVVCARVKATATQAANPGAAVGICNGGAGSQSGIGVGFDTSNNVGVTYLNSAGAGLGAFSSGALNTYYTVFAQVLAATQAMYAWIDGLPAATNQGSTVSGAMGTITEIAFGAQHRSSGFLRQFKGNVEWFALLCLPGSAGVETMSDALAAELHLSGFPYNLLIPAG